MARRGCGGATWTISSRTCRICSALITWADSVDTYCENSCWIGRDFHFGSRLRNKPNTNRRLLILESTFIFWSRLWLRHAPIRPCRETLKPGSTVENCATGNKPSFRKLPSVPVPTRGRSRKPLATRRSIVAHPAARPANPFTGAPGKAPFPKASPHSASPPPHLRKSPASPPSPASRRARDRTATRASPPPRR